MFLRLHLLVENAELHMSCWVRVDKTGVVYKREMYTRLSLATCSLRCQITTLFLEVIVEIYFYDSRYKEKRSMLHSVVTN